MVDHFLDTSTKAVLAVQQVINGTGVYAEKHISLRQQQRERVRPVNNGNINPEQLARNEIERQLEAAGWRIQDKKFIGLHSG